VQDPPDVVVFGATDAEIIDLCTQAIKLWPKYEEAYELRAKMYEELGETELARADRAAAAALE